MPVAFAGIAAIASACEQQGNPSRISLVAKRSVCLRDPKQASRFLCLWLEPKDSHAGIFLRYGTRSGIHRRELKKLASFSAIVRQRLEEHCYFSSFSIAC